MKTLTKSILIILLLFAMSFGLWAVSFADIPHLINYQGKLTDTVGKPVTDGTHSITFRIYDAESAGTLLWEETQSVSVSKGIFSVMLGGVTALNLAFDKPYWLEIKVGTEVMSPRQRMASVGYAYRAENANQAKNADSVGNVGINISPTANKLLPLDSNAKLPASALKVYDSGWFYAATGNTYIKTHNLGTTCAIFMLYYADNASGTNMIRVDSAYSAYDNLGSKGSQIQAITTTQCTVSTMYVNFFMYKQGTHYPHDSQGYSSGYLRVIAIALE